MAWAKPAVVFALVTERNAPEMGADTNDDEPLFMAPLDAVGIRLRIEQRSPVHGAHFLDLILSAMANKDWLAAPDDSNNLTFSDGRQVDFDGGRGGDR